MNAARPVPADVAEHATRRAWGTLRADTGPAYSLSLQPQGWHVQREDEPRTLVHGGDLARALEWLSLALEGLPRGARQASRWRVCVCGRAEVVTTTRGAVCFLRAEFSRLGVEG